MANYLGPPDGLFAPPALQPRLPDPRFLGPPVSPFPLPRIGKGYLKAKARVPRRRRRAAMITLAQYGHRNP